ncbi:MAG TPA: cytochrome c3 family protein [Anaerolineales bacterium]|nr:cytochrome c3 family protein [Anaerolineales bacterium]
MRQRLGCLSGTGLIAASVTALLIAGYVYARGGLLFNPGPLNAQSGRLLGGVTSHAEIDGDCESCHTAPWESATMADRCVVCHTEIKTELQRAETLHGAIMFNNPSLACRDCHPEHRGPEAPLVFMEDGTFPHEAVGFSLAGHQQTSAGIPFACQDCHQDDITTFTADTCYACHHQMDIEFAMPHLLTFGPGCLACHDGVDRYGDGVDHNQFVFQLTGSHAAVTCSGCHQNARTIADLQSTPQDCFSCHRQDEPHAGQFGTDCSACHTTSAWTPSQFNGQHTFPLNHGGGATCATCHTAGFTTYTCYGCHEHEEAEVIERHQDKDIPNFQNCMACHPSGEKD